MRPTLFTFSFGTVTRQVFTYFLCWALLLTTLWPVDMANAANMAGLSEAQLRERFPDAQFIHVDPDDYPQLASTLREQGYVTANENTVNPVASVASQRKESDPCATERKQVTDDSSLQFMVDVTRGAFDNHGDHKSAAVVFVIIGTVVIVVWALYSFKFFYDSLLGVASCNKWSDLSFIGSVSSGDANERVQFSGLRYMTGLTHEATQFGLSFEIGEAQITLTDLGLSHVTGVYWFLGPVMRWQLNDAANPSYFLMNFLAGSTENHEVGLLAQTNVGLQFGFDSGMRVGIHAGAIKLDLNEGDGIVSNDGGYYYLYGVNLGYSF